MSEVQIWPRNRDSVGVGDRPGKLDSVRRFAVDVIETIRDAGVR